jgi:glycosyltransferase involved in cell wall biosynthesis
MKKFEMHKNLVYKINIENIGFDKNLLEVAKMATGEFIMFLGNDDLVIEDGIIGLIKILEDLTPDAVFSNYKITNVLSGISHNACKLNVVKTGLKINDLLKIMKEKITFISSITLKKKCLDLNENSVDRYIGRHFIHVAILLGCLKDSDSIIFSPYPVAHATDKNQVGYNIKQLFLYDLGFIINSYNKLYDNKTFRPLKLGVLAHVFHSVRWVTLKDLAAFKFINGYSLVAWCISKNDILFKLFKKKQVILTYLKCKISQVGKLTS